MFVVLNFEKFLRKFVVFVNKEVWEIVLIISESAYCHFSAAIFIDLSKF